MSPPSLHSLIPSTLLTLSCLFSPGLHAQENSPYQLQEDWAQLPDDLPWGGATSWVTADGKGNILVFVRSAPYFRLFDREGNFQQAWGDDGMFQNAHSVTYDTEGNIWTTDSPGQVVQKFSPDGELLLTLGERGTAGDNQSTTHFDQPNHVAIASNGDIYVTDGYGNARVMHFRANGEFVRIIGGRQGDGLGELSIPHGVALDSRGRILVNDSDNQRVSVFDNTGNFLETWPFPSRGGIEVDTNDVVYISDVNAGAVNIVKDGELLESIPIPARAHGLGLDSDGSIYVSDALGQKVMKITRE